MGDLSTKEQNQGKDARHGQGAPCPLMDRGFTTEGKMSHGTQNID